MTGDRVVRPGPVPNLTPAERRELIDKLKQVLLALEKEGTKRDTLRKKVRAMYLWLKDPKRQGTPRT